VEDEIDFTVDEVTNLMAQNLMAQKTDAKFATNEAETLTKLI
jgi:hypothetical protein